MFDAAPRGSTAGTIGQSSVKRPTLTLRNARSLSTDCHSPLYIFDQLSCARIDSGGTSVDRLRNGFCFRPRLEVADDRVVLADLRGALGRVVVELAEVGRDALRDAGHLLVDLELVVRAVEPDLVLLDRTAEVGVPFPEQQVRVVALLDADAVGGQT